MLDLFYIFTPISFFPYLIGLWPWVRLLHIFSYRSFEYELGSAHLSWSTSFLRVTPAPSSNESLWMLWTTRVDTSGHGVVLISAKEGTKGTKARMLSSIYSPYYSNLPPLIGCNIIHTKLSIFPCVSLIQNKSLTIVEDGNPYKPFTIYYICNSGFKHPLNGLVIIEDPNQDFFTWSWDEGKQTIYYSKPWYPILKWKW